MSFFSQLQFIVKELKARGYEPKAIGRITPIERPRPKPLSRKERDEIREKLINAGASPKVVRNVEKIYEG